MLRRARIHDARGIWDDVWKLRPERHLRGRQQRPVPSDGEVPPQGCQSRRKGCCARWERPARGGRAGHVRVHPRGRRGFGARVPAGQIRRASGHGGGAWGLCARRPAADPRRGVARGNPQRRCGHVPRHGGLDQGGEGALRVRGAAEFRGRGGGIQAEGELGDGGGDGSARVAPRACHDGRQHGGFPGGRPRVGGPGGGDPRRGGGAPRGAEARRGGARGLLRAGRLLPQLGVGLARRRRLQEVVRRGSVGAVQRVARAAGVRGLAALAAHQGRRAK
mmetsp:Transcript_13505/g.59028  ORF Transcript_13505/g.59028 Transcript_13505/m.59028 type:complete len:277 (+) Transcript_13505:1341-2171(+)